VWNGNRNSRGRNRGGERDRKGGSEGGGVVGEREEVGKRRRRKGRGRDGARKGRRGRQVEGR
jgi:hypothetical protein